MTITHVEPCPKCGGWHPGKGCPPRRNESGLVACPRCGHWHYKGNGRYCSRGNEGRP